LATDALTRISSLTAKPIVAQRYKRQYRMPSIIAARNLPRRIGQYHYVEPLEIDIAAYGRSDASPISNSRIYYFVYDKTTGVLVQSGSRLATLAEARQYQLPTQVSPGCPK